jgi:uncharacterized caspase-like protein
MGGITRTLAVFLGALVLLTAPLHQAVAEKRVALVIGNSNYHKVPKLANPTNDAAAIATLLRTAGFDVVVARRDLNASDMRRAVRDFSDQVHGSDLAVVFYAGHGIEFDGTNYLIPVDAALARDIDIEDEAVSLDRIMRLLEPAKKLRLVMLDACRDNPFAAQMKRTIASRSLGRGLAKVEPANTDTLIAFSARAGSTAEDGDGLHSPFTSALLKHITKPGLDIRIALGRIRDEVLASTRHQQEPFVYGSLGGNTVSLVAPPAAKPAAPPAPAAPVADARRDYELANQVGTKEAWTFFLERHPSGFYANLAKAQRAKIVAEEERVAKTEARARAAAQAKVAAEAKAAAEAQAAQAKREADAKAAAEAEAKRVVAARAAEQARLLALEAAQEKAAAEAEAKRASDAKVKADAAAKATETKTQVAALSPEQQTAAKPVDPIQTVRLLQAELRRVGCYPGAVSGNWDAGSRNALEQFNKHAGMELDVKLASLDSLGAIKGKTGRICPLQCARGFRANREICVRIACPRGQVLNDAGNGCEKRNDQRKNAARPEPKSSGQDAAAPAKPAGGGQVVCSQLGCRQLKPGCRATWPSASPNVQGGGGYEPIIVCR